MLLPYGRIGVILLYAYLYVKLDCMLTYVSIIKYMLTDALTDTLIRSYKLQLIKKPSSVRKVNLTVIILNKLYIIFKVKNNFFINYQQK